MVGGDQTSGRVEVDGVLLVPLEVVGLPDALSLRSHVGVEGVEVEVEFEVLRVVPH